MESAVLQCISAFLEEQGRSPTMREIGERVGIERTSIINSIIQGLIDKGHLVRADGKDRNISQQALALATSDEGLDVLSGTGMPPDEQDNDVIDVPIVGRIVHGLPLLTERHIVDTVRVQRSMVAGGRDVFGLRVNGDSMIEAGIFNGDYIFVQKRVAAQRRDIVVVLFGDEVAVRYYYPEKDHIAFRPANQHMKAMVIRTSAFRSSMLLGVVVGMYRKQ